VRRSRPAGAPVPASAPVQIFGFRDCQDTRKAQRFFSERRVAVHFVDLAERPASAGELRRFEERLGAAALVNRESRRFRELGLHVSGDSAERLLRRALGEPRLLRTPLVRRGPRVAVGYQPDEWHRWLQSIGGGLDGPLRSSPTGRIAPAEPALERRSMGPGWWLVERSTAGLDGSLPPASGPGGPGVREPAGNRRGRPGGGARAGSSPGGP
jgi:arsenate reductase